MNVQLPRKDLTQIDELRIDVRNQSSVNQRPPSNLLIDTTLKWREPHDDTAVRINVLREQPGNLFGRIALLSVQKFDVVERATWRAENVQGKLKRDTLVR